MQEIKNIKIKDLVPYERNSKIHSEYQIGLIEDSIKEFGFINPILIDENKNVIAGHGRIEAAKNLKFKELPCIVIEGLTEEQRRAYIIADNRLSELAEWDNELVARELKDLKESGFNTDVTGFLFDDIDFSFMEEEQGQNLKKEKKQREAKECECPRCKCIFTSKEVIQHGRDYEVVE